MTLNLEKLRKEGACGGGATPALLGAEVPPSIVPTSNKLGEGAGSPLAHD